MEVIVEVSGKVVYCGPTEEARKVWFRICDERGFAEAMKVMRVFARSTKNGGVA
jgi:hypothetical protein